MIPLPSSYEDLKHLRWLSVGHYVYAALLAFWSLFGLFFITMGMTLGNLPQSTRNPPPPMFGFLFAIVGGVFTLVFVGAAVAIVFAGRNLARRKNHTFCLIMAGVDCMWFPVGTVLGAFTFAVLFRPSVQALFDPGENAPTPSTDRM